MRPTSWVRFDQRRKGWKKAPVSWPLPGQEVRKVNLQGGNDAHVEVYRLPACSD
jgi:hypothetical protein